MAKRQPEHRVLENSVFAVGFFGMFDEGTTNYHVSNVTPVDKYLVTYGGLPSDWYLKLTGAATLTRAFWPTGRLGRVRDRMLESMRTHLEGPHRLARDAIVM